MTRAQLIAYLRQSCIVQDPSGTTAIDPVFLALTDEQLTLVLEVALSKEAPDNSLDLVPNEVIYPLILTSKKELYFQLATNAAPLYPLSMGSEGGIEKNIRFDHYTTLVSKVIEDYKVYTDTNSKISVGNVTLASRYYTKRNYDLAEPPTCTLLADLVTDTTVELSWSASKINKFYSFVLYKSLEPIVDLYNPLSKIKNTAEKVIEVFDIHNVMYRLTELTAGTKYYVALVVQEANGLKGYSEISFTTQL